MNKMSDNLLTREELIRLDDELLSDPYYQDLVKMSQDKSRGTVRYVAMSDLVIYKYAHIAKAQNAKTTKYIFDSLGEACPHSAGDFHDNDKAITQCFRKDCGLCVAELKEEIDR